MLYFDLEWWAVWDRCTDLTTLAVLALWAPEKNIVYVDLRDSTLLLCFYLYFDIVSACVYPNLIWKYHKHVDLKVHLLVDISDRHNCFEFLKKIFYLFFDAIVLIFTLIWWPFESSFLYRKYNLLNQIQYYKISLLFLNIKFWSIFNFQRIIFFFCVFYDSYMFTIIFIPFLKELLC